MIKYVNSISFEADEQIFLRLFAPLGVSSRKAARNLLISLNWISQQTNPVLFKYGVNLEKFYSTEELSQTLNLTPNDDAHKRRIHKEAVYAIDSDSSVARDDAIACETLLNGSDRVYIHIADVTSWVPKGSPLETGTRSRGQTLYLPNQTLHMFPLDALRKMSLTSNKECRAFTISAVITSTGQISSFELYPSLLTNVQFVPNHIAEGILQSDANTEGHSNFKKLLEIARRRYSQRKKTQVPLDETQSEFRFPVTDFLVREFATIAGEVAGLYARDHSITLPFRTEKSSLRAIVNATTKKKPVDDRYGVIKAYENEMTATHLVTKLSPLPLPTAGLACYVRVTNPLRSYIDMLSHYILLSHIRKEPSPFTRTELDAIVSADRARVSRALSLVTASERYWILTNIEKQVSMKKEIRYEAVVVHVNKVPTMRGYSGGHLSAVIYVPQFKAKIYASSIANTHWEPLRVGATVRFVVLDVDAFDDVFRIRFV
eukprot:TRINITY_DN5485_c0_g1_i1.p1 TRINITY_DN5485_c0_g1~~TRINITY_DN5485_c0_g1_i1.p1  ORF type:complete len:574 (-),score=95.47 TRINITY_DN5485_c0_g1_i1:45-1508(-)